MNTLKEIQKANQKKTKETNSKDAYYGCGILLLIVLVVWSFSLCSKASEKRESRISYEYKYNEIKDFLSNLQPLSHYDLNQKMEEIDALQKDMQEENVQSKLIDFWLIKNLVNYHATLYEVGTVVRDWETDEEISRNTVEKRIIYTAFKGDSLTYIDKVANNTQKRAKRLYEKHYWPKSECMAIAERKVFIGMNKDQLLISWGRPRDINRTGTAYSTHEQWCYGDFGPYIYLEDGVVTSWQD
ncbi:MAG: hypothetical protein PWP64_723 [Candidatus Cloacimonadota bacterium]|nr:hypothetical protein [Candidatus Cloacimonadota bacterium]